MSDLSLDPSILTDFLTESAELIDALDRDLVLLEQTPEDGELLNSIFRALHTIKGSASFLALTNLVKLGHAAESCLNAARNRVFIVERSTMDLLLQAVDTLKLQLGDIGNGNDPSVPNEALVAALTALGEGRGIKPAPPKPDEGRDAPSPTITPEPADQRGRRKLVLDDSKSDLLAFLLSDLTHTLSQLRDKAAALSDAGQRNAAAATISEAAEAILKTAEFFDVPPLTLGASLLRDIGAGAVTVPPELLQDLSKTTGRIIGLLSQVATELESGWIITAPFDDLAGAVRSLLAGEAPAPAPAAEPKSEAIQPAEPAKAASGDGGASADPGAAAKQGHAVADQTIRVEVGRLEALLNLVGELVLQKNRIGALARRVAGTDLEDQELVDSLGQSTGNLDRLTSDIQVAVMRTRMQPLDKLFGKYPRLIRDLSRKTNKKIQLLVEGADTEVDKSVIEELADPLVHLLRNAADHGIEPPHERVSAGKPEMGTIRLVASHEGSHVLVRIIDDGHGLNRERIAAKAIKNGMLDPATAEQLSDREIFNFIFAPGFSTADVVSDLSGRGVGMDVVRTNVEKIKGNIDLTSEPGRGTTFFIRIPLTVAILNAMMVAVGDEVYAIPLHSIIEIVRPDHLSTIQGAAVLRLRDSVLPVLDAAEVLRVPTDRRSSAPFAVVLLVGETRIALLVSRLIGQQQVVIKPLDITQDQGGVISGATVRDDGGVSLILDVSKLVESCRQQRHKIPSRQAEIPVGSH